MASPAASSARILFEALRPVRSRPSCKCLRILTPSSQLSQRRRNVSTATTQYSEMEVDAPTPRWAQTPPAMKAPVPVRSTRRRSIGGRNDVNKDPRRLDEMYTRLLGSDGPSLLSDETKWLAVTHKSFDHGRRGFNDRLAYFGKRIVELQASLGMLSMAKPPGQRSPNHSSIDSVEVLTEDAKTTYVNPKRMADLARNVGLPDVMRWVPRDPDNLVYSGHNVVFAQAIYAIVGALALEQGAAVANRYTREFVLRRLGISPPQITDS